MKSIEKINSHLVKSYYENIFLKFKSGPKAANWSSKQSQFLRFKILSEVSDLNNKSIHDVGCGLGDFYFYLRKKINKFNYLGSDISPIIINKAKKKINSNNSNFQCLDLLKDKKIKKCDFVITSGLFNVKDKNSNQLWEKFIKKMIQKMFVLSKKGIAFNMMKFNVDYKDNHLYYQSIDKLICFLEKEISKKIIIRQDYDLWEYTCYVYK